MEKKIVEQLKEKYPIRDVELLCTYLDTIPECGDGSRSNLLENAQQIVNEFYDLEPSDVLIDVQVIINTYRNEFDITDPREIINVDNGKGFVQ